MGLKHGVNLECTTVLYKIGQLNNNISHKKYADFGNDKIEEKKNCSIDRRKIYSPNSLSK